MLRIVHSATEEVKAKPKTPTRREKAERWMRIQQQADRLKALEVYKKEIEEAKKIDNTFQL